MAQYKWYCLIMALCLFSCKAPQPNVGGGKDMTVKDGDGKTDPVKQQSGVDADIANFRITYDVDNKYEEFGAPKVINKDTDNTDTPKQVTEITSTDHVNDDVENKLAQIRYINSDIDKLMGYRILIYSGNNVSKAQSLQTDLRIALSGTGHSSRLDYEPPNYILKAGRFLSKLKAHQLYTQLKEEFPKAVLITEEINFNRSRYIVD